MTLRQPNYDRMLQLGLHGMAEAIEEQYHLPGVEELGFDDRLAMLLEREVQQASSKKLPCAVAAGAIAHSRRDPGCRLQRGARDNPNRADPTRRWRLDSRRVESDRRRLNRHWQDLPGLRTGPSGVPAEALGAIPPGSGTGVLAGPRPRQGAGRT